MATVKGDVHDIGKNIVGIVLGCNNYKIIDLGVMVPCEKILQTARENKADMIGLSGLITPSLEEMVHVAREMQRLGMDVPLLIGGATTSPKHTAVKIAPAYSREVVHVKDASRCGPVCEKLLSAEKRPQFDAENRAFQVEMVAAYQRKQELKLVSYREAVAGRFQTDWAAHDIPVPSFLGVRTLGDYPLDRARALYRLGPVLRRLGNAGQVPGHSRPSRARPRGPQTLRRRPQFLDRLIAKRWLRASGVYGFWPAASDGDDIILYEDDTRGEEKARLHQSAPAVAERDAAVLLLQCRLHRPVAKRPQGLHGRLRGDRRPGHGRAGPPLRGRSRRLQRHHGQGLRRPVRRGLCRAAARDRPAGLGLRPGAKTSRVADMLEEKYRGIRPAPGYPSLPDHTEKRTLFDLLAPSRRRRITLTESYMMQPAGSVSGLYFAHPGSRYFAIDRITRDQVEDYARRKGWKIKEAEKWLAPALAYDPD